LELEPTDHSEARPLEAYKVLIPAVEKVVDAREGRDTLPEIMRSSKIDDVLA